MSSKREKAVPFSRTSRLSRMARMAGGIAAGMIGEGARQLSQGHRPKVSDMLLTPSNARRLTNQLATMRGAAMKVGQLLSMETNDFLPKELADIIAELRNRAYEMPTEQLHACLVDAYGNDWKSAFSYFDPRPMAAASIGQVHRATTLAGDDIVLKIQYPGVSESINSDVDNLATLLRISKLLPDHIEIDQLLEDTKAQLHEEADYLQEATYLMQFFKLLNQDNRFQIPHYFSDLSSRKVLAMSFIQGEPIERLESATAKIKNSKMTDLFSLLLTELFDLRLMQTDGNFANYLYQPKTNTIALLDFGATRQFSKTFATNYKRLLRGVINNDDKQIIDAAERLGYGAIQSSEEYQQFLVQVFTIALEPFAFEGNYDFANAKLTERLAQSSETSYDLKEFWQAPPSNVLYLHRKIGGVYQLATRLGAQVNVHELIVPYLTKLSVD